MPTFSFREGSYFVLSCPGPHQEWGDHPQRHKKSWAQQYRHNIVIEPWSAHYMMEADYLKDKATVGKEICHNKLAVA
jgi:hypothetical protein